MNYKVVCNFFKPYVSMYGTILNDSFCITRFRTNTTKSMCISIYGARLWNSLNKTLPLVVPYKYLKSATNEILLQHISPNLFSNDFQFYMLLVRQIYNYVSIALTV